MLIFLVGPIVVAFIAGAIAGCIKARMRNQVGGRLRGLRLLDGRASDLGGVLVAVENDKHGRVTKARWEFPDRQTEEMVW